jgi:hypothetical protein
MKKLFLVLALAFAGIFTANAQVWIGGGLGADIQKNHTGINLAPEVGYMIPNTPFTVALGTIYKYDNDASGSTNSLSLQPYFRYVPCTIGNKFSLFLDLTGDFNLIDAAPRGAYAVMVQPGIAWMATDKWTAAFRFGKIGYSHNFYKDSNDAYVDGFLMGCDLASPSIRIYYNF